MKRSMLNKWIAALRAGDYKQGHRQLRSTDDHFCCLGVLCDLTDSSKWKRSPEFYSYRWNGHFGALPPSLQELYGMSDIGYGYDKSLVQLNDEGMSFEDIAAALETNPASFGIPIEED